MTALETNDLDRSSLPVHRESSARADGRRPFWACGARVLESNPIHEDREATEYDGMVQRHRWLLNRPFVTMAARTDLPRARVLDIGTGPGWIPIDLAQRRSGWRIWAVDVSEDMLARARQHATQAGVADRVHWVHGSAGALPFDDGTFDLVLSHFTLHHLARPEEMLNEAARVARPGGRVLIKDLCRQPSWKAALLLAFSRHVLRYTRLQLQMYRESMQAALTVAELRDALGRSRLAGHGSLRGFRGLDFVVAAQLPHRDLTLPTEQPDR